MSADGSARPWLFAAIGAVVVIAGIAYVRGGGPRLGPTSECEPDNTDADALVAFDLANGEVRWQRLVDAAIGRTVVVDRAAVSTGRDQRLGAYDAATGEALWCSSLTGVPLGGGAGLVLVAVKTVDLVALDARSGAERWRAVGLAPTAGPRGQGPAIAVGDDWVAVPARQYSGADPDLRGLDLATGAERWAHPAPPERCLLPAGSAVASSDPLAACGLGEQRLIGGDTGRLFVQGPFGGPVVAIDGRSGADVWTALPSFVFATTVEGLVIGHDTAGPPRLVALDTATGAQRWAQVVDGYGAALAAPGRLVSALGTYSPPAAVITPRDLASGAALGQKGLNVNVVDGAVADDVVVLCGQADVFALDFATGSERWRSEPKHPLTSRARPNPDRYLQPVITGVGTVIARTSAYEDYKD